MAASVLFVKRSTALSYAAVDNVLPAHTMVLCGHAKKMTEKIVQARGH